MKDKQLSKWLTPRGVTQVENFVYEPIPHGQYIRILELGSGQGQIACKLRVIPLEQAFGSYDAVSYCWGDPKNKKDILVNQKRLAIAVSLYDALLHLRHESGSKQRVLWADAICINQKDKEDQSRQVQMMGEIYQHARCVPVWLGLDDQNIAKVCFTLIKETARACRELLSTYRSPSEIPKPTPN